MKISHKVFMLSLVSIIFLPNLVLANDETSIQSDSIRKASSSMNNTNVDRRASNSSKKSNRRKTTSTSNTTTDTKYSQEDCTTKYMAGLDAECYNINRVQDGGVYADCSDKTVADYYDIMDMQLSSVVGINNFAEYKSKCDVYKGYALDKWLGTKGVVETSAVKGSDECVRATKKLTAAKKCYTAAIAHDGNFFEFSDLMNKTCGNMPDVAKKFANAGDMGLSNIPQMLENYSTLQFTKKSGKWRSAIEATLAGYIYDARQSCGEENYDILELNQFTEDKRENILSRTKDSFASEVETNLNKRSPNIARIGKAAIVVGNDAMGFVPANSIELYDNIGRVASGQTLKYDTPKDIGNTTPQIKNSNSIGNIYVIDDVSNLNKTRARLINIISSGNMGTVESRDDIDYAIITGLGGRANSIDTGIYDIVSNISDGDTFVIKDNTRNCQILVIDEDGNFYKLSKSEAERNNSLEYYVSECKKVIE